jgi:hypothetical protein
MKFTVTSGNWNVELPHYAINRSHYIISVGKRRADYRRIFVVSESVALFEEVCNAYAAAAIPQMLEALQQCPPPPDTTALSPQQLQEWEQAYKQWYRNRCSALAKATETPDELVPQVDVDAMRLAFCEKAGPLSPNEIKYLIPGTGIELAYLLNGIKRQKLTVAQQESFNFIIAHYAGLPIELRFIPVYINQTLFLFWESVGPLFWTERMGEWIELMFPTIPTIIRAEQFREHVAELKKNAKTSSQQK